jgi:hypothetical protein
VFDFQSASLVDGIRQTGEVCRGGTLHCGIIISPGWAKRAS